VFSSDISSYSQKKKRIEEGEEEEVKESIPV